VQLGIPKLVKGSFFPSLLEPRRRIDQALWAVMMESYVHGTSTRKVDDLVVALGVDTGVSKSTVSRICAQLGGRARAPDYRSLRRSKPRATRALVRFTRGFPRPVVECGT
jgi:transposase-like protein